MAISVMSLKNSRDGVNFPLHNYEEPYGTIDDFIHMPPSALSAAAKTKNTAKAIFFSFKHLDQILSRYFLSHRHDDSSAPDSRPVINSRILSGLLVGSDSPRLSDPVRVHLSHLRTDGVTDPVCVHWDVETASWSDSGCRLIETTADWTDCECGLMSSFALLGREAVLTEGGVGLGGSGVVTTVVHLPDFHVEIIVASVAGCCLLIILVLALKVMF